MKPYEFQKYILDTFNLKNIKERESLSKGFEENTGLKMVFIYDEAYATDEEDMEYIRAKYGKNAFSDDDYVSSDNPEMLSCIMNNEYFGVVFSSEPMSQHPDLSYSLFLSDGVYTYFINLLRIPGTTVPEELVQKYLRIYKSNLRSISITELLEI